MKLIDKDALVAEIERLRKNQRLDDRHGQGVLDGLHAIERFIDTLEVKEMDLDALGVLAKHLIACEAHGVTPKYFDRELDFLEGLANNKAQKVLKRFKAQKGESV